MTDRIEPIRRATPGQGGFAATRVPPVAPVARRGRERDDEPRERRRREPEPTPVVDRDGDGTPHVDVRA
jgi:hypothetical protein